VHTEASDPEIGEHLTRQIGSPVVVVPALADVPDGALADVYVFDDAPLGPMGFQVDVFDSVPGNPGYSPLRAVKQVRWSGDAQARLLRSAAEVSAAAEAGEIAIEQPGVVINMPFVR
jgi:Ser/Thr protein kinase RdoA (MazF antagonist)